MTYTLILKEILGRQFKSKEEAQGFAFNVNGIIEDEDTSIEIRENDDGDDEDDEDDEEMD